VGTLKLIAGQLDEACHLLEQSLDQRRQLGRQDGVVACLSQLAKLYEQRGETEKASALKQETDETLSQLQKSSQDVSRPADTMPLKDSEKKSSPPDSVLSTLERCRSHRAVDEWASRPWLNPGPEAVAGLEVDARWGPVRFERPCPGIESVAPPGRS
jgi:hypothetical protein